MKSFFKILFLLVIPLLFTPAAFASSESDPGFQVYRADATGDQVKLNVLGASNLSGTNFSVSYQGSDLSDVQSQVIDTDLNLSIVIEPNTSIGKEGFTRIIDGLSQQLDLLPEDANVQIYTAGTKPDKLTRPNSKPQEAKKQLEKIGLSSGSSIVDTIEDAAKDFPNRDDEINSVLVITTEDEQSPKLNDVINRVIKSNAQVYSLQILNEVPGVSKLVEKAGGYVYFSKNESDSINAALTSIIQPASLRYEVSFTNPAGDSQKQENITVSNGGNSYTLSYVPGEDLAGPFKLQPIEDFEGESSFFSSKIIFYIAVLIATAIIALGSFYIFTLVVTYRENSIDKILSTYIRPQENVSSEEQLIKSSIIAKAVSATETFAERRGFSERIGTLLEKADLPIRAGEALFFSCGSIGFVTLVTLIATRSFLATILVCMLSIGISMFVLQTLVRRRIRKFEQQLPDTLQLLAGTLRAGYSLPQGMNAVAKEVSDPMGKELSRAMSEANLGRELEDSLAAMADRLDSPDFAWTVMAIGIQREVGGNLNELLVTVADTITQREHLRGEVKALTAEGRVSAGILTMLPPSIMLAVAIMNPGYLDPLFSGIGLFLLGAGLLLIFIGIIWMRKVISIDA